MGFTDVVPLPSTRSGTTPTHATSPARLLAPARRTVPFVGRAAELASYRAWCADPRPVAVRLVSGPRGVGKTRLAREIAHTQARTGWTCLHVPDGAERTALATVPEGVPALLLVDDAAGRGPALTDLLRSAARRRTGTLRILLVAREAGVWFDRLETGDPGTEALLGPARVDRALRAEVLPGQVDARMVAAFAGPFAEARGLAAPEMVVASVPGNGARMLDLQAAALCAVLRTRADRPAGPVPVDVADALDELLEHERWSWFRSAEEAGVLGEKGFLPEAMDALVAAATLTDVRTPELAEGLVRRVGVVLPGAVPGAPDRVPSPGGERVARWLLDLDPARSLPGRLTDPHLLAELADVPGLLGASVGTGDPSSGPSAALRAALRMADAVAERLDARTEDHGPAVDRLGAVVAALPEDHDVLRRVSGALPHPSLALGELRAELALRTLAAVGARDAGPDDRERLAEAARDAGAALRAVGRPREAERHERRAEAALRELAAADPGRFRPRLAALLAGLGASYADQGRPAEAAGCAREAVELFRRTAADRPDGANAGVADAGLADALSVLAAASAALGDVPAALAASREAADFWRGLAAEERSAPGLARTLTDVARNLAALGRTAEAVGPADEALRLWRSLAGSDPDRHLPGLGDTLRVAGKGLAAQSAGEVAVAYLEEALDVHRRTAEENPGRYLPDLADSLQALGEVLSEAGRGQEGVTLQREAVEVQRRLVADDPGRYRPRLAGALSAVGSAYSRLDRPLAALDAEREATRTWRELAAVEPGRYVPRLARSLTTVSTSFSGLRLDDEAVAPAAEAVELLRGLVERDAGDAAVPERDRHRALLAEALRALALALHDQERFGEAQAARAEAEDLAR
ncbi:tetratricopeptide repeat protein [Promicromonospora thailandica]|uniref:Tetratricopeptide repeat-containing protein n=1 Tax=Promicromonospora thailandica TaxID=765201 RepID=A0A9X2G295_9MICO|nr:tetratricopeptide repeat protein [Promicromonospora thailandica]MCP2265732.1 Tetratricopeptide repeat-containing protein [Promicromonospora thailandica]BFF21746.1 hypothetical protein GCM10025730_52670 [Promicromonospora thailandica]